jgi:hypothetical protein
MREFAIKELNISKSVKSYLSIDKKIINELARDNRFINYYTEMKDEMINLRNDLKNEINVLKLSRSWRITAPLRKINTIMKKIIFRR